MFNKNYESSRFSISLKGKISKYKALQNLAQILTILEEKYGVDDYSNVSLYFNMNIDNESNLLLVNPQNVENVLTGLVVDVEPDDLKVFKNELGQKVSYYDESHKYDLSQDIEKAKTEQINDLNEYIPMTKAKKKEMLDAKKLEDRKRSERYTERQRQEELKRELERQSEQKIIDTFESFLLNENGLKDRKQLVGMTTSYTKIKSRYAMLKYLDEQTVNENEFVFKVRYRAGNFKNASKIIIYNSKLEKLAEVEES